VIRHCPHCGRFLGRADVCDCRVKVVMRESNGKQIEMLLSKPVERPREAVIAWGE
jgi:hypothetical protein